MLFYLSLFLAPAAIGLAQARRPWDVTSAKYHPPSAINVWSAIVVITCIVGFRFQVGGDWGAYMQTYEAASRTSPWDLLTIKGPAYQLINWVSYQLGLGIYGVNLVCGFIFAFGLMAFCKTLPRPWLALAVSTPYLITVVAMGYTRQSVAIGIIMLASTFLYRNKVVHFAILILAAATFHKPAILLLGFLIFTLRGTLAFLTVPAAILLIATFFFTMSDYFLLTYKNYVISEYHSSGAVMRTAMTALPATLFLFFRNRFGMKKSASRFWWAMSLAAITLFVLALISPATTAIDRIALYFLPIQMLVASYLPDILHLTPQSKRIMKGLVVSGYAGVYLIWLAFADHAYLWVPYQTIFSEFIF